MKADKPNDVVRQEPDIVTPESGRLVNFKVVPKPKGVVTQDDLLELQVLRHNYQLEWARYEKKREEIRKVLEEGYTVEPGLRTVGFLKTWLDEMKNYYVLALATVALLCASSIEAKHRKRGKIPEWQQQGGAMKDWQARACAIKNVLVVDHPLISGHILWMHAFQPAAGQGVYAKAPESIKIDGQLRYRESEGDFQSDFDEFGGFAGTSTYYSLELQDANGTEIWSSGGIARHGAKATVYRDGGVSSRTVDDRPVISELIERLGQVANCPVPVRAKP